MRGTRSSTYATQLWFLEPSPPSPFYAHVCFWACPFPHVQCVHKTSFPINLLSPITHAHYLLLTHNAFKHLSIKSYQILNQLKKHRKQQKGHCFTFLIQCLKTQEVSLDLFVPSWNFYFILSRSDTLGHSWTFLYLDFWQLLGCYVPGKQVESSY